MDLDWLGTLIVLAVALGALLLARAKLAEPLIFGRVRMVPWTAILFAAVLLALIMSAHVLTLLGYHWPQRP